MYICCILLCQWRRSQVCKGTHAPIFFGEKKVIKDGILAWSQTLSLNQEVKGYIWSQNAFVKFFNYFCFCLSALKSYYTPIPTFPSSPEVCLYHTVHFQILLLPLSGPLAKPLPLRITLTCTLKSLHPHFPVHAYAFVCIQSETVIRKMAD